MSGFVTYSESYNAADYVYTGTPPPGWILDTSFNSTGSLSINGAFVYALMRAGTEDNGDRILAFRGTDTSNFPNFVQNLYADLSDIGRNQILTHEFHLRFVGDDQSPEETYDCAIPSGDYDVSRRTGRNQHGRV